MKKFVQIAFLLIGGALGLVFLPPLYELLHLSSNPWLDNPYVSVALGALLLFTLSFAFSDYFVRLISWMEEVLFKVPIGDLLFGTFGLIIGLIVAYFLGFAIDSVPFPVISEVLPIILSFVLGYLGFRLGFRKEMSSYSFLHYVVPIRRKKSQLKVLKLKRFVEATNC